MKKLNYIFLAGLLLTFQACTKDFDKLNTNPAGFDELDPQFQLTKIEADMSGDREDTWRYDLGICSPIVQHLGGSWWTQHGGMYQVVEKNHWYSHWETTYGRELRNVSDIIEKTKDDPKQVNMHAAARILRVYLFAKMTDLYGDIPYSQSNKGFTDRIYTPVYDKQEDIYKNFFVELDAAVTALDPAKGDIKGDLFLQGKAAKWKKFGNSLRMRLGFRLTKVDLAEAKKQVEAAISSGVMTDLEDIVMMKHEAISYTTGENRGNGRSQVFKNEPRSSGFRLVQTLVDTMTVTNDPRLYIYGGTYVGDYVIGQSNQVNDISGYMPPLGTVPGAMAWNLWSDYGNVVDGTGNTVMVTQNDKFLQPSKYVSALDAPFFHFTLAEVEFLLAEAAARGWGGVTNVQDHFNKGIQAGCEMMKYYPGAPLIQQPDIDALKAHYNPFPASFNDRMRAIHEQMWVNFFLNGTEAYANFRRTGYPRLVPFTSVEWYSSGTDGVIPRRFFYPESEAVQNGKNYTEAIGRIGGANDWLQRVWWDKP